MTTRGSFSASRSLLVVAAGASRRFTLPRSFLPPFNEGTFTILVQFNPGRVARGVQSRRHHRRTS